MLKSYKLTASVICANFLTLAEQIKELERAGIDYLHIDVMDGIFVPRYGLFPELVAQIRKISKLPMDVHFMVKDPEPYIDSFAQAGASHLFVHPEGNNHLHRTICKIKNAGLKAGVVLNPATPLNTLDYILDDLDGVMIMAINPGIVGHKLIPPIIKKIKDLKKLVAKRANFIIEIDGGVTFDSAVTMIKAGANLLVCGSSTIFRSDASIGQKVTGLKKKIASDLKK